MIAGAQREAITAGYRRSSIIIASLPSGPRANISNTSTSGLVPRVVMRASTLPLVTGSFQLSANVQLPAASQSPSLTMSFLPMLSFQVDQYLPPTLS
ncbi:MAG: hypothetical protein QM719_12870 [Thermomonas sp.]